MTIMVLESLNDVYDNNLVKNSLIALKLIILQPHNCKMVRYGPVSSTCRLTCTSRVYRKLTPYRPTDWLPFEQ